MNSALRLLAFMSPIGLTAIWAAAILATGLTAHWPAAKAVAGFVIFALPVAWSYAVFSVCRSVLLDRGEPVARADWVFVLAVLGLLATTAYSMISGLPDKSDAQSFAEIPMVLLMFASFGVAGRTFDRAEALSVSTAFNRAFLNAIVLLFQPIGFWVLRCRLLALKALLAA